MHCVKISDFARAGTCLRAQTYHSSHLGCETATKRTPLFRRFSQNTRKNATRGIKLANEKVVSKRFHISVLKRVNMIGQGNDTTWCQAGLA